MPTYYVMSNDGVRHSPTISSFGVLEEALEEYRMYVKMGNKPLLLKEMEVTLNSTDGDTGYSTSVPVDTDE